MLPTILVRYSEQYSSHSSCYATRSPKIFNTEFSQAQGSFGLPTVCCFIPSQHAGAPFQVSVHSWETPIISHVTRAYSKHIEDVKFEVRLFIDGRLTAYANTLGPWL